jgi:hypothetical protein
MLDIINTAYGSSYQNLQFHIHIKKSHPEDISVVYLTDSLFHKEV